MLDPNRKYTSTEVSILLILESEGPQLEAVLIDKVGRNKAWTKETLRRLCHAEQIYWYRDSYEQDKTYSIRPPRIDRGPWDTSVFRVARQPTPNDALAAKIDEAERYIHSLYEGDLLPREDQVKLHDYSRTLRCVAEDIRRHDIAIMEHRYGQQ